MLEMHHSDREPSHLKTTHCAFSLLFALIYQDVNYVQISNAFGPYWSIGRLQELSRHPDPGPVSQVVIIITITIIITIVFGPYRSIGRLKQLSRASLSSCPQV